MEEKLLYLVEGLKNDSNINKFSLGFRGSDLFVEENFNMELGEVFSLCSVTKLFISAAIFSLADMGEISLEDGIGHWLLEDGLIESFELEYFNKIKLKNLLYQNSSLGLGDFDLMDAKETIASDRMDLREEIDRAKKDLDKGRIAGNFSHYSSVNFSILGRFIEKSTGEKLSRSLKDLVFDKLDMENTYLAGSGKEIPPIYFGGLSLDAGGFLKSKGPSAGGISSLDDLGKFAEGFFKGRLFDRKYLKNSSYYPMAPAFGTLKYGLGHMRLECRNTYFLGHNGISGAFLFYSPEKDFYAYGTLNQANDYGITTKLIKKLDRIIGG